MNGPAYSIISDAAVFYGELGRAFLAAFIVIGVAAVIVLVAIAVEKFQERRGKQK